MDKLVADFSLLGLVSLAVMTYVCTLFVRRAIELAFPVLKKDESRSATSKVTIYKNGFARWYNEFLLYLLPYLCAALFALSKSAFLFGAVQTYVGRLFLATFVATFSSIIYKAVKKGIPGVLGVQGDVEDTSTALPPTPPEG